MSDAVFSSRVTQGFSLIEVLITAAILTAGAFMLAAATHTVPLIRGASLESIALRGAHQELETLRALGYASIPATGTFTGSAIDALPSGTGAFTASAYNDATKLITVTVSWQEAGHASRSTTLTTLITKTGGL